MSKNMFIIKCSKLYGYYNQLRVYLSVLHGINVYREQV